MTNQTAVVELEPLYREIMNKAIRLLAVREHSLAEMRRKLLRPAASSTGFGGRRRRYARAGDGDGAAGDATVHESAAESAAETVVETAVETVVEAVIEALLADGVLSDERFAESFVRVKVARGGGPIKIRAELRQRGVDDEVADEFLTQSDEYWLNAARAARDKRFGTGEPDSRADWGRRARFLSGRGFPSDVIYRLLGPQQS